MLGFLHKPSPRPPISRHRSLALACLWVIAGAGLGVADGLSAWRLAPALLIIGAVLVGGRAPTVPCILATPIAGFAYGFAGYTLSRSGAAPQSLPELLSRAGLFALMCFLFALASAIASLAVRPWAPAPRDHSVCSKCDYALVGLTETRCPECGTPFDPDEIEASTSAN